VLPDPCPPRHRTHFEPSFLEPHASNDVVSYICLTILPGDSFRPPLTRRTKQSRWCMPGGGQSDKISHVDWADDHIDTVMSHIISPYHISIFTSMSYCCPISLIDLPYRYPIISCHSGGAGPCDFARHVIGCQLTQQTGAQNVLICTWPAMGLADIARHIIECRVTRNTRVTVAVYYDTACDGPDIYCSPRHRMTLDSRDDYSKCVSITSRSIFACP